MREACQMGYVICNSPVSSREETILDMAKGAEQTNDEMLWERPTEKIIKSLNKS